ncbi:MAG: DUF420 domain-containing protein [Chlamydiae bacterium]|nr:DUF420 domain-containing protein [Chlamydiota bacterium]MBI3277252.1 DUF420 domain-containing protein [Chlamydiota bacterium]
MIPLKVFPALNATLNGTCGVFLGLGYYFIRRKRILPHKICMLSAFSVSIVFLASYLYYHAHHGVTHFWGTGWIRPLYFSILISHTFLAVVIVPLALITLYQAWKERFQKHVKIARWTFPLWLYVSITGVIIYWMLYMK